jgi:hypothetical protein
VHLLKNLQRNADLLGRVLPWHALYLLTLLAAGTRPRPCATHIQHFARALATRKHLKKCRVTRRHGWNQQVSIEKQIPHLATCLGNEQAAVTCRAVRRTIATSVVRLVIGAHWIIRADWGRHRSTRHASVGTNGQALAYVYFEEQPVRQTAYPDEAWRMALPELLRRKGDRP